MLCHLCAVYSIYYMDDTCPLPSHTSTQYSLPSRHNWQAMYASSYEQTTITLKLYHLGGTFRLLSSDPCISSTHGSTLTTGWLCPLHSLKPLSQWFPYFTSLISIQLTSNLTFESKMRHPICLMFIFQLRLIFIILL